jgi:hypothetical protein
MENTIKTGVKSLYKFEELLGTHAWFGKAFKLIARAGTETYIDGLLEELPNCVAVFENINDDHIRLQMYFFPNDPDYDEEEGAGSYTDYQGTEQIFLSQKDGQGADSSICFFNNNGTFELCDTN